MNKITYIADSKGWVQSGRYKILNKYLGGEFQIHNLNEDVIRFFLLKYFKQIPEYTYFASWRMVLSNNLWEKADLSQCMTSVTSHSNIGGGLNLLSVIGKNNKIEDKDKVFKKAVNILKRFKVVTVNSMRLYELLYPSVENIVYLPNGVEFNKFIPFGLKKYNRKKIVIGWVGKRRAAKNYELLKDLKKSLDNNFVLKELIIEKNQKSILNQSEMVEYYNSLDFYLCTSWDEGTPNPALEAASCGVPIISTKVGNMPELIVHGENGFFIEPQLSSLIKVLNEISLFNEMNYNKLSSKIRKDIVENWTWEKQVLGYKKAFEKLLKKER